MAKKQYALQVNPEVSRQDQDKLNKQFANIASGFGKSIGRGLKGGASFGAKAGMVGLALSWWDNQKKSIDSVNSSFDEYLANADRLGTIANDLGTSASSFALTDVALSTYGLKQEDRDKMYSSIKGAQAEGTIVNQGGNLLGSLTDIQKEYQIALKNGDIKRQEFLKGLTGLRGQKATEFLSGDLQGAIDKLMSSGKFNKKDIDKAVNKGGDLEQQQAEGIAEQNLSLFVRTSKLANSGIIKSQEQLRLAIEDQTLEQYANYDEMVELEISKRQTTTMINRLINTFLNPIIGKAGTIGKLYNSGKATAQNVKPLLIDLVVQILTSVLTAMKDAIVVLVTSIWDAVTGKTTETKEDKKKRIETIQKQVANASRNQYSGPTES
jgi:hypothetical protein